MTIFDNTNTVKQQYASVGKLENRISLHEKYSMNKFGWFNWLYSNYDIKSGDRILELGCGNGKLWAEHYSDLPECVSLVLSDFSESMIKTAKELIGNESISYQIIDIQDIPYPDNCFDIVIANMMLYHVPDMGKGLREIKRVLKGDGKFHAATLGENGISGFIRKTLGLPKADDMKFTLQNGAECLKPCFSRIEMKLYEDSLEVTDTNDLITYIHTLPWTEEMQNIPDSVIFSMLEEHKNDGVITIPKEYGTFIAYNE
ncbi:MAG: class I SAM-dependent methyltransferase [Eubacteriales bacterium]|nr:class I SAM-dependent methyltransferase [Eubacteriales bacterium]